MAVGGLRGVVGKDDISTLPQISVYWDIWIDYYERFTGSNYGCSQKADATKAQFRRTINQALKTKESINAYFRGEITIRELHARGIKFVKTI